MEPPGGRPEAAAARHQVPYPLHQPPSHTVSTTRCTLRTNWGHQDNVSYFTLHSSNLTFRKTQKNKPFATISADQWQCLCICLKQCIQSGSSLRARVPCWAGVECQRTVMERGESPAGAAGPQLSNISQ